MKAWIAVLVAVGLAFAAQAMAHVRDLPRSDPSRSAILDAARGTEKVNLVVKDLFKSGDYAFLCALKKWPSGGIIGTDGGVDVYQWVLVNDDGKWRALDLFGDIVDDLRHVSCTLPRTKGQPVATMDDIVGELVERLEWKLQGDLDYGKIAPELLDWLNLLQRKTVLLDVAIEHEKRPYDPVQLKVSLHYCKSDECRRENEGAFQNLVARTNDPKISSLVWSNCARGLRVGRLGPIRSCVDAMTSQPYCRPNMHLVADRKDIDSCVAAIRELCVRELGPGPQCR